WDLQPQRVITTNYDRVLQWANPKSHAVLSGQSGNMQEFLNPEDNPMVWHLHGHVDDSDTLVLTKSQYTELYSSGESGSESSKRARFTLQSIWASASLLFIGFGLRDRYVMESLLGMLELFGGHARERFVLMCEQDQGQFTAWDKYRITPVLYTAHGEPLRQLLQQIRQQSEALRQAAGAGQHAVMPALPLIPASYGQWLESDCRDVLPFGMEQKQQLLMHLRQVYVPALVERQKTELQSRTATKPPAADSEDSREEPAWELLMAAIQQGSLLVEGDPGAGKSTFCRWLWLRMMCDVLLQELVETPEEFREQLSDDLQQHLLAVRVPLRELNDQLCAERRNSLDVEQLQQMLGQCLDRYAGERGLRGQQLLAWLHAGRVLLLLDGVDEVPVEQGAGADCWQPRQVLLE
ncbi:MAG: SIR2 family protein, partial [Planctomycetaceae bacterium]